jgi:hypothetical protein
MVSVASQQLECRDGIGDEGTETVDIKATENCHLLVIDVPLH